jgi:hypothetical protein
VDVESSPADVNRTPDLLEDAAIAPCAGMFVGECGEQQEDNQNASPLADGPGAPPDRLHD